jgi:hypothetical protein
MTDEDRSPETDPEDRPGKTVIDEPTAHALDDEADPNNEWEAKATEQAEASDGADSGGTTA